jgi:hypothetical protein
VKTTTKAPATLFYRTFATLDFAHFLIPLPKFALEASVLAFESAEHRHFGPKESKA